MNPLFRLAVTGAIALAPSAALPENSAAPEALFEIKIDIDRDGRMDRAVLVGGPGGNNRTFFKEGDEKFLLADSPDLYVYLGLGDDKLELARKPAFLKKRIIDSDSTPWVYPLETKGNGSLLVKSAYLGGNESQRTLTIVYRDGKLQLAGYTLDWDTRNGIGHCDINFLSGKAVISKGLDGKSKPLPGKFAPITLDDWFDDKVSDACR